MGETLALFEPSFNRAVKVEARPERLSSDAGAILLREALDQSGIIEDLAARLNDPRDPRFIEHPLPELLRSLVMLFAQSWDDLSDVGPLRDDPVLALARSARRGVGAAGGALASQPTLSRLLDTLARPENAPVIDGTALRLAGRRLRAAHRGRRRRRLTIDVDGLPLPVHGAQPGSAYNGHVGARIHYPLIASCAETGDMLGALLRPGNAGPSAEAKEWIPQIVEAASILPFHADPARLRTGSYARRRQTGPLAGSREFFFLSFARRLPSTHCCTRSSPGHKLARSIGTPPQRPLVNYPGSGPPARDALEPRGRPGHQHGLGDSHGHRLITAPAVPRDESTGVPAPAMTCAQVTSTSPFTPRYDRRATHLLPSPP